MSDRKPPGDMLAAFRDALRARGVRNVPPPDKPRKPNSKLVPCANCGENTMFQSNSVGERAKEGWCAACWTFRHKNLVTVRNGKQYWRNAAPHGSVRGYASRPTETP